MDKATPKTMDYNKARKALKDVLFSRDSFTCDHCERQYDDSICDKCWPDFLLKKIKYTDLMREKNDDVIGA